MARRCRAMESALLAFLLLGVLSVHVVAAHALPDGHSTAVTPAFVWSDLRCFGEQDRSVNYESQSSDSLVDTVFHAFGSCEVTQDVSQGKANPEMVVAFIGRELRSEDISRSQFSDVLMTLQESIAGTKYSLSFPYVTVASNRASVGESLISNVQKKLGAGSKIGQVAVSGSCSVGRHDVKRLTGVPDIEAYIAGRKTSRAQEETDVLLICYSPALDWNLASVYTSEGKVLEEVLSALKSSGTSNFVMYTSDPLASTQKHYGILERHLLDGTGNATTDCDALCRSRAVILEGIFVAITLITILVSGICCMKAVKSPSRFEVSKES
ncbi:hypothetical protein M758_6G122700 [Ceratodon purpureus]|nr:hypothetical protein M758_6G122700 [Ceratodon purpureus]